MTQPPRPPGPPYPQGTPYQGASQSPAPAPQGMSPHDGPAAASPAQGPSTRPATVTAASVLGGLLSVVMLGTAIYTLVVGLAGASGGGEIVVLLLAFIIGGFGALVAIGVIALNHKRFPNPASLTMAAMFALGIIGLGVVRSFRFGGDGPELLAIVVWLCLAAVAVTLLVLLNRPSTTQWTKAVAQRSLEQGYQPRRRRGK
jgi:hypothetical protein